MSRHTRVIGLCLAVGLVSAGIPVAAGAGQPVVRAYELDVSFLPAERTLSGTALIRFHDTDQMPQTVTFYLHGELDVESVSIGTQQAEFRQTSVYYYLDYSLIAKRVTVETGGKPLSQGMRVTYSGPFNRSKARSPSDYMRIEADGVLLRAFGYSLWFPVFLEADQDAHVADFAGVTLRVPKEFTVVFTGTHEGDRIEGDTRISKWTAPGVAISDAQCTARKFEVVEHGKVRLYHERNPSSSAVAGEIAGFVRRLDELFRRDFRSNAVSGQLHIMQMPRYGEISSRNVVGMTGEDWDTFADYFHGNSTLAHELIHPFVQLQTARDDPLYAMAVEGFPSFMHYPALAELDEEERYDKRIAWYEKIYLSRKETGTNRRGGKLPPEKPLARIQPDEIGAYKDSFVLGDRAILFQNWLRQEMGVEEFRQFTRELFATEQGSYDRFRQLVLKYLPDAADDLELWMETSEYPDRIRLAAL